MDKIIIKGAREHNLKNVDVVLPRDKFIVITGVSGSGKSTLAFDTIYAEGQRRYVESLSSYARQFLGLMNKPDVDSIEGLSPAISIEQKTTSKSPRSTVGTITEIYDYLRLLFARVGIPYCSKHNLKIEAQTPQKIAEKIKDDFKKEVTIFSPVVMQKKGTYERLFEESNKEGYTKIRVDGDIFRTDEKIKLSKFKKHNIEILIDKISTTDNNRLAEAVENSIKKSGGLVIVNSKEQEKLYSSNMSCPVCSESFEELQPRMFSFNNPFGACEECHGLGIKMEFDSELIISDKNLSIIDGALKIYGKRVENTWRNRQLKDAGFDLFKAIKNYSKKEIQELFYGNEFWEGLIPQSERLHKETQSDYRRRDLERFMRILTCPKCSGKRLKKKILSVKIDKKSIIDITDMPVKKAIEFFYSLFLTKKQEEIAKQILKEIKDRLKFLDNVGLGYLTLSRSSGTLSGGEAQRIRLATQIGSNLTGVLYVLDEPSIGLHQKDNHKLIETLHNLRDLGNTLIVIEHDEDTIRKADYVLDIGPEAGVNGGRVIAFGAPSEISKNPLSYTGQYLSGKEFIEIPEKRRELGEPIIIIGAKEHNLKNIEVKIPTRTMNLITGVSGSGKSTLVNDILYKAFMKKIHNSKERVGKHTKIVTHSLIENVYLVDQSPIGKTPRSNPSTYTKVFDEIRKLFSLTKESRARGYSQGRFSFNVSGGRCEACRGDGTIKIEMSFLPDVYVECEECKGKRYNKETLEIKYKDKSITEVLNMSVDEALKFFEYIPSIRRRLQTLKDVGLGYLSLGQGSNTLSGGESQRIKLTRELSKRNVGNTLYIMDEPTTGLHFHDIKKFISVVNKLVDKGNTVIIIEHNLDVIKCADYIIDLGPDGGDDGGEIVAEGTPEEIVKNPKSYTGQYLKKELEKNKSNDIL